MRLACDVCVLKCFCLEFIEHMRFNRESIVQSWHSPGNPAKGFRCYDGAYPIVTTVGGAVFNRPCLQARADRRRSRRSAQHIVNADVAPAEMYELLRPVIVIEQTKYV